jgi:hypothetical protein
MLRIIAEECCNNKTNLLCCFIDFRKYFDSMPRMKLWDRLKEIRVPFDSRDVMVRLYENGISKFRSTNGWSKEINCNIGVKQGCPLSPTLFDIYMDKLEYCLEKAGCVIPTFTSIVIILLLHANGIVLMVRSPYDINKKLKFFL